MIRDFNVEWLEKIRFITAQEFQTYVTGAGVDTGSPVFQNINSSGVTGIQIDQANDSISTIWHLGNEVDTSKQIRFRVWSSKNSTDADVETLKVLYKELDGSAATVAVAATALSTAIPAFTYPAAANVAVPTDFGIINRNTIASTTQALILSVESTMTNASADEISIIGLEIRYTPRRTAGPRRNVLGGRRLLITRPTGVQLATSQEGL